MPCPQPRPITKNVGVPTARACVRSRPEPAGAGPAPAASRPSAARVAVRIDRIGIAEAGNPWRVADSSAAFAFLYSAFIPVVRRFPALCLGHLDDLRRPDVHPCRIADPPNPIPRAEADRAWRDGRDLPRDGCDARPPRGGETAPRAGI